MIQCSYDVLTDFHTETSDLRSIMSANVLPEVNRD